MKQEKGILTIEEAVPKIDKVLDKSERRFYEKYGKYPNLLEERDYVLLAEFLDCNKEAENTHYSLKVRGIEVEYPQIYAEDLAYRLMRRFFQRSGFFGGKEQDNQFAAFFGNLYYNAPRQEKEFRISAIENLVKRAVSFPTDYKDFLNTLGTIAGHYPNKNEVGICFLPKIYNSVWDKPEGEKTKIGFEKVGTHLVNPSAGTLRVLKNVKDYGELIDIWKRLFRYD